MADETPPPDEEASVSGLDAGSVPHLEDSDVFGVLSTRRRRYVLFSLMDATDGVAELDDLADQVHQWERATDDEVPDDNRDQIVAALHHVDLPRLSDVGLVEFDPRSGTVRYRGDEEHEAVLELIAAMGGG